MATSEPGVPGSADASPRVLAARSAAVSRSHRQRALFRSLACIVVVLVAVQAAQAKPGLGAHGRQLAVTVALVVYCLATVMLLARPTQPAQPGNRSLVVRVLQTLAMAAAGITLAALQPHGPGQLAASAAVWVAMINFSLRLAAVIAVPAIAALAAAAAATGAAAQSVTATVLLCLLLAATGRFMRQAQESHDRAELLLAQLEDAREAEAAAAAVAERGRIARELHDVLAHALSALAIQLQAARKLAQKQQAGPELTGVLTRSAALATEGLAEARKAVSALRADELPKVSLLPALIDSYRRNMQLEVSVSVEGPERQLTPERSAALFRAAQEALTNVARYAPGSVTTVRLRYGADRATLRIEDRASEAAVSSRAPDDRAAHRPAAAGGSGQQPALPVQGAVLAGAGGGHGLAGMRERVEQVGGSLRAGPTGTGWLVEVEVPS